MVTLADRQMSQPSKGGESGGSYSNALSINLIFWNEIRRLQNEINPPLFDAGIITEVLGQGKYKVKLQDVGTEIIAVTGEGAWITKEKSAYLKGAYALILITSRDKRKMNSPVTYSIISVRQTGVFAPKPSEYEV